MEVLADSKIRERRVYTSVLYDSKVSGSTYDRYMYSSTAAMYSISQKNASNTVYHLPVYGWLFSVQNGTETVNGSYRFSVCRFSVYRILPYTEDVMLGMYM